MFGCWGNGALRKGKKFKIFLVVMAFVFIRCHSRKSRLLQNLCIHTKNKYTCTNTCRVKLVLVQTDTILLDPRLPSWLGGIFPGPATTQGIEWFSQLAGLQWLTVFSMLNRGITLTLTGEWHSGRLAALSPIMLRNSLLTEGKLRHISVLGMWWLTKLCFSS